MKKIIIFLNLSLLLFCLNGCKKEENNSQINVIVEPTIIETETSKEEDIYKTNEEIVVSGTTLKMYDSYKASFYGSEIDFIDVDFIDYNFGISLPKSVFDPNNLYYINETNEDGNVLIRKNDANKIILNFMDDYHYTTFCYSTGIFSTWSYTIDEETYENLKYSDAYAITTLLTNEDEISYKNGYDFEKHFDNKEENAYRILMEIDYYPFTEESSSLFYHGYLVLLVHNTDIRAICFAEPKFSDTAPYQMGYPVINSSYWLDVPIIKYNENEDLETIINTTPTPIEEETSETIESVEDVSSNNFSTITPSPTKETENVENNQPTQSLSTNLKP